MTTPTSQPPSKQYKVFFINHEEPKYRVTWVVPDDFVMPDGYEIHKFLGMLTVSDPMLIKNIDEEIHTHNFFRLGVGQ